MSWALACFFGEEWYAQWEEAANYLLKLSEQHEYAWPADAIFGVWAELWNRWCEELREIDRRVLRELREEAPSYDRIRFYLTAPGADGQPWLRLPRTFDLEAPDEYFQRDVMGRQTRALNRACWGATLRRPPSGVEPRKAGADPPPAAAGSPPARPKNGGREAKVVGANPSGSESNSPARPFIGPTLSQEERTRAMSHAPKSHDGSRVLCWTQGLIGAASTRTAGTPMERWASSTSSTLPSRWRSHGEGDSRRRRSLRRPKQPSESKLSGRASSKRPPATGIPLARPVGTSLALPLLRPPALLQPL
jgi:hypothetical protein